MLESMRGYPEHHWFALGHLAEAEDELAADHSVLADLVRLHRKRLEADPAYQIPFASVILEVAGQGQKEVESKVKKIEQEFENASTEELMSWWKKLRE